MSIRGARNMLEKQENFWELPLLSFEDQRLRDAYVCVGKPVDQLPYSPEFDRLVAALGMKGTDDQRYFVFQRLLSLRKRGRLPQLYGAPSEMI
jgi:hypothetical protein